MAKKVGLILLCILAELQISFAQSTTGNLEGWIFDNQNQPVIAANIYITSAELQGSRGAATDARGYFHIQALPVGKYNLRISHISFKQVTVSNINVLLGQTTSIGEVKLNESSVETGEVIVSADKPVIDTRSTTNGKSISSKEFAQLPIERNYFHIAELLPNANQSSKGEGTNFAGGTGVENRYFVDGAEVSTPTTGVLFFELPYNFVRQVEIQTGGYQAEYQTSLGGILNTVTYSGGNEFHGTIFGFLTNNNFSRSPRLSSGQPPQGKYSNYDIGFGIGGPLIKDRIWYYIAYDPDIASEDVYVEGLGMQNSHSTKHKFAGKLTWSVNENNMLTISVSGDNNNIRNVYSSSSGLTVLNPEYCTSDETDLYMSTNAKGIHNLSDKILIESSISYYMMKTKEVPISAIGAEPFYEDYVAGTASGGLGFSEFSPVLKNFSASIKGTLVLIAHRIKAGFEYVTSSSTRNQDYKGLWRYPNFYGDYHYILKGTVKQKTFSTFIQDSWQLSQRFCLNAGIRWDPQWLIASDGTIAQKITDQWQPRIGIIYQPGELGVQKITASFGRFYESLQLSLSVNYHIKESFYNYTTYPNDPRVDTSGGRFWPNLFPFVKNVPDVGGQYYDEFSLGYERMLSNKIKLGIRGIYRYLGQGVEDGVVSEADQIKYNSLQVYGNPGSGVLSMLPQMERKYLALELTLERFVSTGFNYFISYVLSRNWGNYDGLANTYDANGGATVWGNATNQFGTAERMINADGLLPNDRTHVFKFFGSYKFDFELTTGIIFQWMSGTPLNELGVDAIYGASTFLQPRGSVGRTPSIWDLNFRFMYDFSNLIQIGSSTRLILDILHVASKRAALEYYQYHYYDYAQNYVDPQYMKPVKFQPPMSVRMGMEMNF